MSSSPSSTSPGWSHLGSAGYLPNPSPPPKLQHSATRFLENSILFSTLISHLSLEDRYCFQNSNKAFQDLLKPNIYDRAMFRISSGQTVMQQIPSTMTASHFTLNPCLDELKVTWSSNGYGGRSAALPTMSSDVLNSLAVWPAVSKMSVKVSYGAEVYDELSLGVHPITLHQLLIKFVILLELVSSLEPTTFRTSLSIMENEKLVQLHIQSV